MVLSVVVYNHKLTLGQWAGAAVVFAGISVEAWVKRRGSYYSTFPSLILLKYIDHPHMRVWPRSDMIR